MKKTKTIQMNEEKLLARGLQQSQETNKKEAQILDQEAVMLRKVMELSLKESEVLREAKVGGVADPARRGKGQD